jgi:hypothetical protein
MYSIIYTFMYSTIYTIYIGGRVITRTIDRLPERLVSSTTLTGSQSLQSGQRPIRIHRGGLSKRHVSQLCRPSVSGARDLLEYPRCGGPVRPCLTAVFSTRLPGNRRLPNGC